MTSAVLQSHQLDIDGFHVETEARLVCADTFCGVFHVFSKDVQQIYRPPVVVLVPGKWKDECDAHRAAKDYAALMAADGALATAVALRLSFAAKVLNQTPLDRQS